MADAEPAVPVIDAKNRYQPTLTSSTNEEKSPSFIPLNLTRYFPAAEMATAMSCLEYQPRAGVVEPCKASALLEAGRQQAPKSAAAHSLFIGVSLALRLGLRRGEVFGLRWEDVDRKGKRLTVARSFESLPKNGKARTLPIPSALLEDLERWRAVCPRSQKVVPIGTNSRTGLALLLKAAKCKPLARGWHGLRHTFASIFIEQGGSILALKDMLGHSSLAMSLVYSHLAPSALARDIERMKI